MDNPVAGNQASSQNNVLAELYLQLEESTREFEYDIAKLARMFNRSLNSIPSSTSSTLEALIVYHYLKEQNFQKSAQIKLQQSRCPIYGQNIISGGNGIIVRLELLPSDLQRIIAGYISSFIEVRKKEF